MEFIRFANCPPVSRYMCLLFSSFLVLAAGCSSASRHSSSSVADGSASPGAMSRSSPSLANGRSIYKTGRDSNGEQIHAQPAALYPNCAACHGANGAGGLHLPGGAVSADLRHEALVGSQTHPYTAALVERAISTGIDNNGQVLNRVMPRWKLSKRDLHDVAYYVLTTLK